MQFVKNGPDIPERLLQAQAEGRVIFFCGAGISYPAGLPGFKGLVEKIYTNLDKKFTSVEKASFDRCQYDTTIGLFEKRIGRYPMRKQIIEILKPDLTLPASTSTHEAILTLSTNLDGKCRLITTNFDRIFKHLRPNQKSYSAPFLPIPKKSRWEGVVYLHGIQPDNPDANELDQLVVSSGDFGLAYLNERWASRFLTDLFRCYSICFVGYSIEDPVLRYMMDALAADQTRGELLPEMFAFGSYENKRSQERTANTWRAKNVTPILYKENKTHSYLHKTLNEWATIYRDGISGKQSIIARYAAIKPLGSVKDDFVGRVIWAISDSSGVPAQKFADHDPLPPIEWLIPLSEDRFKHSDLIRFGIQPNDKECEELKFSLAARPAPYTNSPWMRLIPPVDDIPCVWDKVMYQIARWLVRHLDKPELISWVLKQGAWLHPELLRLIDDELNKNNLPIALAKIWRLFVANQIAYKVQTSRLYHCLNRIKNEGLTTANRLELLEFLSPRVQLKEPFPYPEELEKEKVHPELHIKKIVDWDITLTCGDAGYEYLKEIVDNEKWAFGLPNLLSDLTGLIRHALDLMRELDEADDLRDGSYFFRPSIAPHEQNQLYPDWTILIDLCRDAWFGTLIKNPDRAKLEAQLWLTIRYPLFRRLAFFAATYREAFSPQEALHILLSDNNWWLWSIDTKRETIRLLVSISAHLTANELEQLTQSILLGPPSEKYHDSIPPDILQQSSDREIWLRLAKCSQAGAALSEAAKDKLKHLSGVYPQWKLASNEQDEFPSWIGNIEDLQETLTVPKEPEQIMEWLVKYPKKDFLRDDNWHESCRSNFGGTITALIILAQSNSWLVSRWREALEAWTEEQLALLSWSRVADIILNAPEETLGELSASLSWWLRSVGKMVDVDSVVFFGLVAKVLDHQKEKPVESDDDVVTRAINHPVGRITEAILNWWYRGKPKIDQGLPGELKLILSKIIDPKISVFIYGRTLLAEHLTNIFLVDPNWAKENILPLFNWKDSHIEACAAWEGFLCSPRLYRPLMQELKSSFLNTAQHYDKLGKHSAQYASLLVVSGLEHGDTFTETQIKKATHSLPQEGLENAAKMLVRLLKGANDKADEYWSNRIKPYIEKIWPKSAEKCTPAISELFTRLCIAAGKAFIDAFDKLQNFLGEKINPCPCIHDLEMSEICQTFPKEALDFIEIVIGDNDAQWASADLRKCLDKIKGADLILADSAKYKKILQHCPDLPPVTSTI